PTRPPSQPFGELPERDYRGRATARASVRARRADGYPSLVGEDLSDLGEFEVIRRLLARLPEAELIVPPGDDTALVTTGPETLATSDLLVEGRHVDLAFSSPAD